MRRAALRLVLVGAIALAAVVAATLAPRGGTAEAKAPAAPLAGDLTLTGSKVIPRGHGPADKWNASAGGATWDPPFGHAQYTYSVPSSIPAAGAKATISVSVTSIKGSRFAPGLGVEGKDGISGSAEVHADSSDGKADSNSASVTLTGSGSTGTVEVGLQDGPLVVYTFKREGSGGGGSERCTGRRTQTRDAINEVRIVALKPDVQYHCEGEADLNWHVADQGTVLKQGDEISIDPDGYAVLAFADNSTVTLRNTTQLKIASFFTEGGVVRTEILLKMGEVAAKVNKSEATKSDFRIKSPTLTDSVRGTIFSVFYDKLSKVTVTSVTRGLVEVDPTSAGLKTVDVPAGKEVAVMAKAETKVVAIGKAGTPPGAISREAARALVLKQVARSDEKCKVTVIAFGLKAAPKGWIVTVRLAGGHKGWATWRVTGTKAVASNPLAKTIVAGC